MSDVYTNVNGSKINGALGLDRSFREAWNLDERNVVVIDMTKAKNIYRDKLRLKRVEEFEKNDIDLIDAMIIEDEDKKSTAIKVATERRNYLRNVTDDPQIEAAQTPEELKSLELL